MKFNLLNFIKKYKILFIIALICIITILFINRNESFFTYKTGKVDLIPDDTLYDTLNPSNYIFYSDVNGKRFCK